MSYYCDPCKLSFRSIVDVIIHDEETHRYFETLDPKSMFRQWIEKMRKQFVEGRELDIKRVIPHSSLNICLKTG